MASCCKTTQNNLLDIKLFYLNANNISLSYPVFGATTMSMRKDFIRISTGAKIESTENVPIIKALNNISFSLNDGDRLGLIGHNGAGKSTLLKVLAGIYQPEQGVIDFNGKIVSTLNINLGMNLEATGIENIISRCLFYNLTNEEIDSCINDIIDFTDLGNYIYMPIRTLSTGMRLRIAFATVTSINSDIILMDEVIGAGDTKFLKKIHERLNKFINRSRILVLASHNMNMIKKFCNKALILSHGELKYFGSVQEAIDIYESK